jgi:hypothetical protein
MFYPSNYFDTCNGLIPQVVLSSMLLQAANERSKAYSGVFLTDISQSTTWTLAGDLSDISYLNISGWLPIAESRYLISQQSIVSRISAMNPFNVVAFTDILGLPQAGFNPRSLPAVVLPAGVEHLSTGDLILEKRLAYLLIRLHKRNLLYNLYNVLRAIVVNSVVNTYSFAPGTGYAINQHPVLFMKLVNLFLGNLFAVYPRLEQIIFNGFSDPTNVNRLEDISEWLKLQLESSNPMLIPYIDPDFINGLIDTASDTASSDVVAATAGGTAFETTITAAGDVSSEITSTGSSSGNPIYIPLFGELNDPANNSSDSPIAPRDNSPLNNDKPVNSLPEC